MESVADPRIEQPLDAGMVLGHRGDKQGRYGFNYGMVFGKAISMGHGQGPGGGRLQELRPARGRLDQGSPQARTSGGLKLGGKRSPVRS